MLSIKNIQVKKALNDIITKQLKTGVNPDMKTMTSLIYDYFQGNPPGLPVFNNIEFEERSKTNKDKYNIALNEIEEDLKILYDSIIDNNSTLVDNFINNEIKSEASTPLASHL